MPYSKIERNRLTFPPGQHDPGRSGNGLAGLRLSALEEARRAPVMEVIGDREAIVSHLTALLPPRAALRRQLLADY